MILPPTFGLSSEVLEVFSCVVAKLKLGATLRTFDVAFLDCDGVLFDSNPMKSGAMAAAVAGRPDEAVEAILAYHAAHGGISRYEKLRYFFTEVHPVDDAEVAIADALERFGAHARDGYRELDPLPAALPFVRALGGPASVYVVSGSDQEELRAVFEAKGLRRLFADVLGSPTTKPRHLNDVLTERAVAPERAVLIGDGRGDFEAAREVGLPFVFLEAHSDWADARRALEGAPEVFIAPDWATLARWVRT